MIQIKTVVNSIFTSKTYILYKVGCEKAWLVDIGDIQPVLKFLDSKGLTVDGVFITHAHFDHIYGIEALVDYYPKCKVFVTEYAKQGLASDKLNLSRYHGTPIIYEKDNIMVVHEGDVLSLFENEPPMEFYETPGHNPGCLTMVMGDNIFTGDAYIPKVGANIHVRYSDKELAQKSMERILLLATNKQILAGH